MFSIKSWVIFCCFMMLGSQYAYSFQNEPDGFRDGLWEQTPDDIASINKRNRQPWLKKAGGEIDYVIYKSRKQEEIGGHNFESLDSYFKMIDGKEKFYMIATKMADGYKSREMLKVLEGKFGEPVEIVEDKFPDFDRTKYIWSGEKTNIEFSVLMVKIEIRGGNSNTVQKEVGPHAYLKIMSTKLTKKAIDTSGF